MSWGATSICKKEGAQVGKVFYQGGRAMTSRGIKERFECNKRPEKKNYGTGIPYMTDLFRIEKGSIATQGS